MTDQLKINAGLKLLAEASEATLATLDEQGFPFATLVTFAVDDKGRLLLLLSNLARHTKNLSLDQRASLLIAATQGTNEANRLARSRGTFVGRIEKMTDAAEIAAAKAQYVARHPSAATYAEFPDFHLYALTVDAVHMVEGFGRIFEIKGADLKA